MKPAIEMKKTDKLDLEGHFKTLEDKEKDCDAKLTLHDENIGEKAMKIEERKENTNAPKDKVKVVKKRHGKDCTKKRNPCGRR